MAEILHPFVTKPRKILRGTFLINVSSKKNAFVRVFTLTIRHFETGLVKSGKNPVVPGLSGRKLGLREDWNYSLLGSRVARDVMGRTKLENHALLISAVAVIAKKT